MKNYSYPKLHKHFFGYNVSVKNDSHRLCPINTTNSEFTVYVRHVQSSRRKSVKGIVLKIWIIFSFLIFNYLLSSYPLKHDNFKLVSIPTIVLYLSINMIQKQSSIWTAPPLHLLTIIVFSTLGLLVTSVFRYIQWYPLDSHVYYRPWPLPTLFCNIN